MFNTCVQFPYKWMHARVIKFTLLQRFRSYIVHGMLLNMHASKVDWLHATLMPAKTFYPYALWTPFNFAHLRCTNRKSICSIAVVAFQMLWCERFSTNIFIQRKLWYPTEFWTAPLPRQPARPSTPRMMMTTLLSKWRTLRPSIV